MVAIVIFLTLIVLHKLLCITIHIATQLIKFHFAYFWEKVLTASSVPAIRKNTAIPVARAATE